jgi:hypothetical protein
MYVIVCTCAGIPTPQMLAGHGRLLRYLLEHGADPNVADDDGASQSQYDIYIYV